MKHVWQRNSVDCGVAVAAMVAGVSWTAARRAADRKGRGVDSNQMVRLLGRLTRKPHRVWEPVGRPPLEQFLAKARRDGAALVIRPQGRSFGHWVTIENGKVRDPELLRAVGVQKYSRRSWPVIRVVSVRDA